MPLENTYEKRLFIYRLEVLNKKFGYSWTRISEILDFSRRTILRWVQTKSINPTFLKIAMEKIESFAYTYEPKLFNYTLRE